MITLGEPTHLVIGAVALEHPGYHSTDVPSPLKAVTLMELFVEFDGTTIEPSAGLCTVRLARPDAVPLEAESVTVASPADDVVLYETTAVASALPAIVTVEATWRLPGSTAAPVQPSASVYVCSRSLALCTVKLYV